MDGFVSNLRGMVAQQLIPALDGKGRRAAIEVLINTWLRITFAKKFTRSKKMTKSTELGMQTFDQALYGLAPLRDLL